MRTLSSTLLAAQRSHRRLPYAEAKVYDYEQGIARLSWTRIYQGEEPDNHHGIAFDGQGSMHRIRAGTGNTLYWQKQTLPFGVPPSFPLTFPIPMLDGPALDQWTLVASDCAGPCAIACPPAEASAQAGKIYIFYKKTDDTLRKYYSHDYGNTWTNEELVPYAGVTHLAAAFWGTTANVHCYTLKAGIPVKLSRIQVNTDDQSTTQSEWHDGTHVLLEAYGIGVTFDPWGPQMNIIIAGKQSDSPYNHIDLFRTRFFASFAALDSIISAPVGENVTYEFPDCHLPANAQSYETARIVAVEKFTGTTAYTRPITTHLVKGTFWTDTTFTEPRPLMDIAPSYGLHLSSTSTHYWLSMPAGVWRAPRTPAPPLDLTPHIIALEQYSPGTLKLTLDNSRGFYNSPPAPIRPGAEIALRLGYKTPNGNESAPAGEYWIDTWEHTHAPATSTFTITAVDGWKLLERWRARFQMRWNKDQVSPREVWAILYQLLARVGICLTDHPPKPQSSAILNFYPDFTIYPGMTGTHAVYRLLMTVPDRLVMTGQQAFTKDILPDEASCYQYGTDHHITTATYTTATPTARTRALGRAPDGSRIVQEAVDWTLLERGVDYLDTDYDPNLTTATRAQERADALLRKHALASRGGQITVPVNCGQELCDVVTITDARCGVSGQKRRILDLHTLYDTRTRRYDHVYTLASP